MGAELTKIIELLGLGSPLLYAGATYWIFHWLDTRASNEAKTAMTGWFKPLEYDRDGVSTAILEIFDRIYSRRLLSWRAFRRSATISTILTLAYWFKWDNELLGDQGVWGRAQYITIALLMNILSDYVSLFVVRRWLTIKWRSGLFALVTGAIVGGLVVYASILIRLFANDFARALTLGVPMAVLFSPEFIANFANGLLPGVFLFSFVAFTFLIPAALAVHLWLILLASGVFLIQLANYLFKSVAFAQWFFDKGDEHPLEAVGYVAALIVFISATSISILGRALS